MKKILIVLMLIPAFESVKGQYIYGETQACVGDVAHYRVVDCDPKKWDVFGGTITSGQGTQEIDVTWTSAGENLVGYVPLDFETCPQPTSKTVTVYDVIPPVISPTTTSLGNGYQRFTASSPAGASEWEWTVSGFGLSGSSVETTSSSVLEIYLPNKSLPGTVCVKALFEVCVEPIWSDSNCRNFQ